MGEIIKIRYVTWDKEKSAYTLSARKGILNLDHMVNADPVIPNSIGKFDDTIKNTVYNVNTIHDSHGQALMVIAPRLDEILADEPSVSNQFTDTEMLDYLVANDDVCTVNELNGLISLKRKDRNHKSMDIYQTGVYNTIREAITAAMNGKDRI